MPLPFRKLGILFVVSYVFLYFLYAWMDFLPKWDAFGTSILHGTPITGYAFVDPLFLAIPVVGFGLMVLAMDAYAAHFKDNFSHSILFALSFIVTSYVAFFVAMLGYYWNNAFLVAMSQGNPSAGAASFGVTLNFVFQNFIEFLLRSPFFLGVLAALLGWLSVVLIARYWNDSPAPHASPLHHSST